MGFKSLTLLQMFPMCLHISLHEDPPCPSPSSEAVRLILSSGRIRVFRRSIPAGEVMSSHPLHLVCRSDSLFIGQRVPPLGPSDVLIPGEIYLLFPSSFFSSPLSFPSLAASFSSCNLLLLRRFEIHKTPAGKLQLRVSDRERSGEEEEEEEEKKREGMVCTTEEMERDYREMVVRARVWKPKLETIRELERKGRAGFVRRNGKKKKNHLL